MPQLRVLVVEDEDDHFELLRRRLGPPGQSGWAVDRRATLAGAVRFLDEQSVDAVLLDLGLPDSSVDETLRRFRDANREVALVVLTSLDDLDHARGTRAVAGGAQDFLVKSELSREKLLRTLRYAIERKQAASALERSNEELRTFAHTVAHEVRNPAAAALMALTCVRQEPISPAVAEMVGLAEEALRTLRELVSELLEFAEVEGAAAPVEPVDLNDVADRVVARFRGELEGAGGRLAREPLPTVRGHPSQLTVVLQNLIGNAIKYRSPDRDLEIRLSPSTDGTGFAVTDNGPGIAPRHLTKLFDVFYRADPHGDVPGTGVGLALCRRIARRYGGDVAVHSTEGRGSVFQVTFTEPGAEAGDSPQAIPDSSRPPAA